jgi:hypothetical protein
MGAFSSDWLACRETADDRARSRHLARLIAASLAPRGRLIGIDLGAGTGSNVRYLLPLLAARQRWTLVDGDASLLSEAPGRLQAWAARRGATAIQTPNGIVLDDGSRSAEVRTRRLDLAVLDDESLFEGVDLVSASALLDLVSESWLASLAARGADRRSAILFALTYDGRVQCSPTEPEDEMVISLVNDHQRSDKGFGPALGPTAGGVAGSILARAGYEVHTASSDWRLGPADRALQQRLIDGWAEAAREVAPGEAAAIERWAGRRRAHVDDDLSELVVGHQDLAALWR